MSDKKDYRVTDCKDKLIPGTRSLAKDSVLGQLAASKARTEENFRGGEDMNEPPYKSPWGEIQDCDRLCTGVFQVTTASHGGTMVSKEMAAALSPAARKCGFQQGGFLCFEEDSQEDVVLRELLDKRLWSIPDRIQDKAAFEENINQSIRRYNPQYWRARQRGRENAKAAPSTPSHVHER